MSASSREASVATKPIDAATGPSTSIGDREDFREQGNAFALTERKPVPGRQGRSSTARLVGPRAVAPSAHAPSARAPIALAALALGAGAVGALAIGRLAIGRATIKRLSIDELAVRRLRVEELEVAHERRPGSVGHVG
jgi:hypothetical protein